MKITPRLTLFFLGLSLVPMGLLSLEFFLSAKQALREEILENLGAKARHLEELVQHEIRHNRTEFPLERLSEYPMRPGWVIEPFRITGSPDTGMAFEFLAGVGAGQGELKAPLGRNLVAAHLAQTRKDTVFSDVRDYRGVAVLAAVRFIEATDWGLVVKVDQQEAYAPIQRFRNRTLLALALASLAAVLCSLAVSRRVVRPLLDLIGFARDFSSGKLDRRAPVRGRDELAELSASLNLMAGMLSKELQTFIDRMSTQSAKLDLQGRVILANSANSRFAGAGPEELVGRSFLETPLFRGNPGAKARMGASFAEALQGRSVSREESLLDGESRLHFAYTLSPIRNSSGKVEFVIFEAQDITDRKEAQAALLEVNERLEDIVLERTESLQAALKEKDVLLKEVHHRVKNNLQIISSLLSLQSVNVRDPQVAGLLTESRNRVKSMALVHERLYAGDDLGKVGFSDYIRDVTGQLVRASEGLGRGVQLEFDLEEIHVSLPQAVPCGLAIHELVSNSLKHAFPEPRASEGPPCRVAVRSRPLPEGGFELEVEDNGVGIPPGLDLRKCRTLGLQLVFTLIRQMKGVLEVDCDGGTRVRIAVSAGEAKES